MIQPADIEQMSLEERLQTMDLLWDSLARTPDALRSPDWHGEVLAPRLAKIERGEGEFLTMPQLKERLHRPPPHVVWFIPAHVGNLLFSEIRDYLWSHPAETHSRAAA